MARGRKPKGSKGAINEVAEALDAETKVSSADAALTEDAAPSQRDEVWDLMRVIRKSESIICRFDGCNQVAVATWASNLKPDDTWDMCVNCQEKDFGGWPEGIEPPTEDEEDVAAGTDKTKEETSNDITNENFDVIPPETDPSRSDDQPSSSDDAKGGTEKEDVTKEDDGSAEIWDLKRVLSIEQITKECPVKCSTEECPLPACCVWVSSRAPTTNWYSCLDCQANDFDGWPPLEELPVKSMTMDHRNAIASKCSRSKAPAMPQFLDPSANLTPLPNSLCDSEQAKLGSHVTPSPAVVVAAKPSAAALAAHKKWQDEAEALNGPGARLVVGKPEAKKLIFDVLHDAFRPMTMADIHKVSTLSLFQVGTAGVISNLLLPLLRQALRALVPSPVLRSCLQDMTLDKADIKDQFCDSDDDDDGDQVQKAATKKNRKPHADAFAGSLDFKAGKGANSILYYADYSKLQNNGDGLDFDQRNELVSKLAKAQADEAVLKARLEELNTETAKLLSEPTNEQLIPQLEAEEPLVASLREKLESARMLKVNEKHRKQTQKRIDNMAAHWRKRKRLCMDFLITMEESTDGTVSVKKCLSGNGQIDIDSDEAAVTGTLAFQKKKNGLANSNGQPPRKKPKLKSGAGNENIVNGKRKSLSVGADDSFVAVKLDVHGSVCRVYLD
jgi:hypothetical protein